jgi:hypothetical protein
MTIYGFAMLDRHQLQTINPAWSDTMRVSKLPSFAGQYGGREHLRRRPAEPARREGHDPNRLG